jgi:hypothetical protein
MTIIVPTKRDTLGVVSKQVLLATPPTDILNEQKFNDFCMNGLIDYDFIKDNYTKLTDLNWSLLSCNENLTHDMLNHFGHHITWKNVITFAKPSLLLIKLHLSHFDIKDVLFYRRDVLDDEFIDSLIKSKIDLQFDNLYGFKCMSMLHSVQYKDYVLLSGRNGQHDYHFIKIDDLIKGLNDDGRTTFAKNISVFINHLKDIGEK